LNSRVKDFLENSGSNIVFWNIEDELTPDIFLELLEKLKALKSVADNRGYLTEYRRDLLAERFAKVISELIQND